MSFSFGRVVSESFLDRKVKDNVMYMGRAMNYDGI